MDKSDQFERSLRLVLRSAHQHAPTSDFDLNPQFAPVDQKLREASVLIPLQQLNSGWHILLTKRSSHLKHHPGQISFPGGKVEDSDADNLSAALRESHEEIGLNPKSVSILGALPTHQTVTSFSVTPFVGIVPQNFTPILEHEEVAELFTVPISHVLDSANYVVQSRIWQNVERRFFTVAYGPHYIWGATARILRLLASAMEVNDEN